MVADMYWDGVDTVWIKVVWAVVEASSSSSALVGGSIIFGATGRGTICGDNGSE